MKSLVKKLIAIPALACTVGISNPEKIYSQSSPEEQDTTKKGNVLPNLNFYSEEGKEIQYSETPTFYNYFKAWLCECPKSNKRGDILIYYGDTDNDGMYDYVRVDKFLEKIFYEEHFKFHLDTKKLDYRIEIKDKQNIYTIKSKNFEGITKEEAEAIGKTFSERVSRLLLVQKEFNRFNTDALEKILRWELIYTPSLEGDKPNLDSKTPIRKFFSQDELNEVSTYFENQERQKIYDELKKKELEEKRKKEFPQILNVAESGLYFGEDFLPSIGFSYSLLKKSPKEIYNGVRIYYINRLFEDKLSNDVPNSIAIAYRRFNSWKKGGITLGFNRLIKREDVEDYALPFWPFFEINRYGKSMTLSLNLFGPLPNSILGASMGFKF